MEYLTNVQTRHHQREQAQADQVPNSEGGYVWEVDDFTRLRRFLVLGSEGGSFYASEQNLTIDNARAVERCIKADGLRTLQEIRDISVSGRAPKNDPAIFALAMAASLGDDETRKKALDDILPVVCRIGTHLFHFAEYAKQFRGWGRGMRRAVADWYTEQPLDKLAFQTIKYRQRDGWSHRDLLRKAHPVTEDATRGSLFKWIVDDTTVPSGQLEVVQGFKAAQMAHTPRESAQLIREYNLPREAIQTDHLKSPEVWDALLERMPMTAMIRNLATMTRVGILAPLSDATKLVLDRIGDAETIHKARVHPVQVLVAQKTYEAGHGLRGSNTWSPVVPIVDALSEAFYVAFDNVEPTNKRYMLALDVSGSMSQEVFGVPGLSAREAAAALAMVIARTEAQYETVAFSATGSDAWVSPHESRWGFRGYPGVTEDGISPLAISPNQRLTDVMRMVEHMPFGGTDCALPMLYAADRDRRVDVFVALTDNETWAGNVHPAQALRDYRRKSGIPAKLAVAAMTPNPFSIADPADGGMLDFCGFDTALPTLLAEFAKGTV